MHARRLWLVVILIATVGVAQADTIAVDVNDPGCVTGSGQPDPYSVVYCTIGNAVLDSSDGDLIRVSPGTYQGFSFEGRDVTVYSANFGNPAVVSGPAGGGTYGPTVSIINGEGSGAVLYRLIIENGNSYFDGGGIKIVNTSPKILRCEIRNNTARNNGGGIFIQGSLAAPTIDRNLIHDNTATNQQGAAITCLGATPTIRNNIVYSNTASTNCAAIYLQNCSDALVRNNTIAENSAEGVRCSVAGPALTNCIVWNNLDDLINCTATYCCISDGDSGTGNIDDDPMFITAAGVPHHLDAASPCIGRGDPNLVADGETDIDGDDRILNGRVEIGADEVVGLSGMSLVVSATLDVGATILVEPNDSGGLGDGVTPFVRYYDGDPEVTLTISDPTETFLRWEIDDIAQPADQKQIVVTMDQPHSVRAIYLDQGSSLIVVDQTDPDCVGSSGQPDPYAVVYCHIQDAITDASAGDTILVRPAVYPEYINFLGKAITLTNVDPTDPDTVAATVIDASTYSDVSVVTFGSLEGPDSVIRGFKITGGSGSSHYGGGIYCYTDVHDYVTTSPTIEYCVIEGNTATYGAGVALIQSEAGTPPQHNPVQWCGWRLYAGWWDLGRWVGWHLGRTHTATSLRGLPDLRQRSNG